MLYSIIRLTFLVIAIIVIVIITRKTGRISALSCGLAVLACLTVADMRFPIENITGYLKTPQQAFSYCHSGEIKVTEEGENSALIIYEDDESLEVNAVTKGKRGWKVNPFFSYSTVYSEKLSGENLNCNLEIYRAKDTDDYYVLIDNRFTSENADISDNRQSEFRCTENPAGNGVTAKSYTFYAYVKDIGDDYEIKINDETVKINIG